MHAPASPPHASHARLQSGKATQCRAKPADLPMVIIDAMRVARVGMRATRRRFVDRNRSTSPPAGPIELDQPLQ
jgi:hypothetical protein